MARAVRPLWMTLKAVLLASALPMHGADAQTRRSPAATTPVPTIGDTQSPLGLRGAASSTTPSTAGPARPANPTRQRVRGAVSENLRGTVAAPVSSPVYDLPEQPEPTVVSRRRRLREEDPYAPLGLRLGNILVLPAIEQSVGYDANPNRGNGANAPGSLFTRTDAELRLRSDWSRNELTGQLRAGYSSFRDVEGADRPDAEGSFLYRHDITRQTRATLAGRLRIDTERPGSPDLNAAVVDRPIIATYGTELGLSHQFNRLTLGIRGSVDRTDYEDAKLTNGDTLDQADRNFTQYGVRLRAAYEASPALEPFIELQADTRQRDEAVDRSGFQRSSDGYGAVIGTRVELTRKLTGEVSAGYQTRHYDDRRLADLRGPIFDGAIIWSVSPLTEVRAVLVGQLGETSTEGSSGTTLSRAGLTVQHDLRRNLRVTAGLVFSRSDYQGIDLTEDTLTASIGAEYKLSRSVSLRSSFTHERLTSTSPGSDYTANIVLVGLRLQR